MLLGVAAVRKTDKMMFDSDPRLQVLMRVHQGVTPGGMATVSETVSKPASETTIRQNLPVFAETRQNSRS